MQCILVSLKSIRIKEVFHTLHYFSTHRLIAPKQLCLK